MASQRLGPTIIGVEKPRLHILSTVIIVLWIMVVGGTVALLEGAVVISHCHAKIPWHLSKNGLPSLLITLIAQAHTPITAMHLARLAVSTLSTSVGRPCTWIELFMLADRKWAGPVGMAQAIWIMIELQFSRLSVTFYLFSLISASTLALPLTLQRAYIAKRIDISLNESIALNTFAPSGLVHLDAYAQVATGGGGWSTGQSVLALFNRTSYLPAGRLRADIPDDIFFAGDVQGRDVTLPGIRMQGRCDDLGIDPDILETAGADKALFKLCKQQISTRPIYMGKIQALSMFPSRFNLTYCSDIKSSTAMVHNSKAKENTIFLWYTAPYVTAAVEDNKTTRTFHLMRAGVVRCRTRTLFGQARLNGRNMSYTNFVEDESILQQDPAMTPVLNPLSAVIWTLEQQAEIAGTPCGTIVSYTTKAQLGYTESTNLGAGRAPPTPQKFAEMIWNGATHMAASLSILSRTTEIQYDAIAYASVSGYERDIMFFYGVLGLLGFWVFGLFLTTTMFLRRTFCDSMNSYVAAQILVQRPDHVTGVPAGPLDGNKRLLERLGRVQFTHWRRAVGPNPLIADSGIPLYV